MRIAVFGSGGVGGYFGAKLAEAGEDVVFIARGEHLRAIRMNGLKVESVEREFVIKPAQATDDPSEVGHVDFVILGVKAWQVVEAARESAPMIDSDTCVLPLQNGVEAADQLAVTLGREHVLGGLCKIISFIVAPGVIRHAGLEPNIVFGELDNRRTARAEKLLEAFTRAGVNVQLATDIQAAIWSKFIFIAPYSGVGAVTRSGAGIVRRLPETRELLESAMREVLSVARARDIALPDDAVQKAMANVDSLPENATSSMQRDIMAGRPSELDSQNEAVVRLGRESGVETPVNSFIYSSLLPLELIARDEFQSRSDRNDLVDGLHGTLQYKRSTQI